MSSYVSDNMLNEIGPEYMILGIGMDVVEVKRIERMLSEYGDRFLKYVFTEREQAMAPGGQAAASGYYAGRWAAKEAISKVLGTGIGAHCGWRDITIEKNQVGRPCPVLSGRAEQTAYTAGIAHIHVTISHEGHLACAAAVGEGAAAEGGQHAVRARGQGSSHTA